MAAEQYMLAAPLVLRHTVHCACKLRPVHRCVVYRGMFDDAIVVVMFVNRKPTLLGAQLLCGLVVVWVGTVWGVKGVGWRSD